MSLPEEIAPNVNYNAELITALCKAFKYQKDITQGKQLQGLLIMSSGKERLCSGYILGFKG